ncbi:hypothetical protein AAMO2058_001182300 [Amorphochlora amoebiformis]
MPTRRRQHTRPPPTPGTTKKNTKDQKGHERRGDSRGEKDPKNNNKLREKTGKIWAMGAVFLVGMAIGGGVGVRVGGGAGARNDIEEKQEGMKGGGEAEVDEVIESDCLGGWRYTRDRCVSQQGLVFTITDSERRKGWMSKSRVQKAADAFRQCGLVVLQNAISAENVERFRRGLDDHMGQVLESRERVRKIVAASMAKGESPQALWKANPSDLHDEAFFTQANIFRERNDGRIDFRVSRDIVSEEIYANPFAFPILLRLLGSSLKLKSMHAIQALSPSEGASLKPQHWHRDTGLLFPDDEYFQLKDVHNKSHGIHLPPYAINQFIPLTHLTPQNGPTEFTLGSHQWGTRWIDDEEDGVSDARFYVEAGSIILSDYRTIHRGTVNLSKDRRPIGMLIWGREWWSDTINYKSSCMDTSEGPRSRVRNSRVGKITFLPKHLKEVAQQALEAALNAPDPTSCGNPGKKAKRKVFFNTCVNAWGESLAMEINSRFRRPEGEATK